MILGLPPNSPRIYKHWMVHFLFLKFTKVKSAMALYQKIHVTRSTICVKSFMGLWNRAWFLGSLFIYSKNSHLSCKKRVRPSLAALHKIARVKSCEIQVAAKKWELYFNNNSGLIPASLGISTKFTWIDFISFCHRLTITTISWQPPGFHNLSPRQSCVGLPDLAAPFLYLNGCFWVDFTSFCLTFCIISEEENENDLWVYFSLDQSVGGKRLLYRQH